MISDQIEEPVAEGTIIREAPEDGTDITEHVVVTDYTVQADQRNEIIGALNPPNPQPPNVLPWPTADPVPVNEFDNSVEGMASMAFIKLFPLGQADPTKKGRRVEVKMLAASSHLLRFAERDPSIPITENNPNGTLYYPFAEHQRFTFWIVDRIRRHRALDQCKVFLKQNPNRICSFNGRIEKHGSKWTD